MAQEVLQRVRGRISVTLMDKRIVKFIQEHYLLTLLLLLIILLIVVTFTMFIMKKKLLSIFSSDLSTKHVQEFIQNPNVVAIHLSTNEIEKIKGVQILGLISELNGEELLTAKKLYVENFPYSERHESPSMENGDKLYKND